MAKLYALCTAITLGSTSFGQVLPRYHATHLPNSRFTAGVSASGAIGVFGPHPTYGYYVFEPGGSFQRVPEGFSMVTAVGSDGRTFLRQDLGGDTLRPWLWDRNGAPVRYHNPAGAQAAEVASFNSVGQAVGYGGAGSSYGCIRWNSPTSAEFLRNNIGDVAAFGIGIDDDGYVVGVDQSFHGLIWAPGAVRGTYLTLGSERLAVHSYLSNGWILASSWPFVAGGQTHVFSRTGTHLFSIGSGNSEFPYLYVGNRHGILVGSMGTPPFHNANTRAVIWSETSGIQDLTSLTDSGLGSGMLTGVHAVADNGIVYAWDNRDSNNPQLYMLTPVPEPGSLVTLGLGAFALLRRRNRA